MIGDREARSGHGAATCASAVDESDPDDAVAAECQRIDIETGEFAECPWGQDVTARLVPGDRSLLDERDVMAGPRQQIGDRCSGGTTADDEDVGVQRDRRQPAAEPSTGSGPTGATSTSPNVLTLGRRDVVLAGLDRLEDRRLGRAPGLELFRELLARRIGAAERVALVADDGDDLGLGQLTTELGHDAATAGDVRATRTIGVAVDLDAGGVEALGAVVDVAELVLDVWEGLEDLFTGERVADAAATGGTVAAGAVAVDLGALAERTREHFGALGDRADVHEGPDRHEAQRGHRPERDLLALLGGLDVDGIGLGRRRGRRCGCTGPRRRAGGRSRGGGRSGRGGGRRARRGGSVGRCCGVVALSDRGAPLARPLQQMFGNLGHWGDDRWPSHRCRESVTGREFESACTYAQPRGSRETCVPDFAHLTLTTTVRERMSRARPRRLPGCQ